MTARLPILVLNGGSSSIKFSLYDAEGDRLTLLDEGEASGIGTPQARLKFSTIQDGNRQQQSSQLKPEGLSSFPDAVREIAGILGRPGMPRPVAIGHRVVHSGPKLHAHQRITPEVLADIEQATSFAPLHQPIALEIVREAMQHFAAVENYACFDTVFHQTMPEVASIYPLPEEIRRQGVHRYGFHGLSCESILPQFDEKRVSESRSAGKPLDAIPPRLIIAHLGSGASLTAVQNGKSLDTTMGLTPSGGVLMGTRPGDLDPGVIFYLLRGHSEKAHATDAVERLLNHKSGLLALSGTSNDMRVLRAAAASGDSQAALAIEAFVWSVKKAIGGFIALMGGLDALVFTGGIGEHDALTRAQVCAGLQVFGIQIDPEKNEAAEPKARRITLQKSSVSAYVLPAQENLTIAAHVARLAPQR
ncbi:MAG: acetate/propionate family kinase [Acidobacteriaceae bacterium]